MLIDARALPVTAAGPAAVAALDATVAAFCGLRRDTGDHLKRTLAADPQLVMAHILKGYFLLLMSRRDLVPRAAQAAVAAASAIAAVGATPREAAHLAALEAGLRGDLRGAGARWDAILRDHPRDLAALKLAQFAAFYLGDSAGMRRTLEAALACWDGAEPGYGFALGCRAFAREECGDYAAAERDGRRAVEFDPSDLWAAHAVAHVYEMTDRPEAGLVWLAAVEPQWGEVNNFVFHARWHRALFLLALGRQEEVLELYDCLLRAESTEDYLDIANAVSLLWRLEQAKLDVGPRWRELAERSAARIDDHMLVFADLHYLMALAAVGDDARVAHWLAAGRDFAQSSRETAAGVMAEIGLALGAAALAHRRGDWSGVVELLLPVRQRIAAIGGSHAQRDLFEQMLIDAALAGGRPAMVRAVLEERRRQRPDNAWGLHHQARFVAAPLRRA